MMFLVSGFWDPLFGSARKLGRKSDETRPEELFYQFLYSQLC
jgi:hypothetical protein